MRGLLFLLLSCCLLAGCGKRKIVHKTGTPGIPELASGTFITSPGAWRYSEANFSRTLDLSLSGRELKWKESVSYVLGGRQSQEDHSQHMMLNAAGDPWFIYVESPRVLWFCNGSDTLRFESGDIGTFRSAESIYAGKFNPLAEAAIPPEIISRLPAKMQDVVPESIKRKRPSI